MSSGRLALTIALSVACAAAAPAEGPVLSERVGALIDEKGVDAARRELPVLVVSSGSELRVDEAGMLALADRYMKDGKLDAAELVLGLQMLAGNSADVAAKWGDLYVAKGAPPAALTFYRQALLVDPGHERARQRLEALLEQPEPGGLLPRVLVSEPAEPAELAGLDWDALRERAGGGYPSRWDDLTLVDSCLWISPDELAEQLGIAGRVTSRRVDSQCRYRVHPEHGDESLVLLSVYVELHDDVEQVRENERGFREGVQRLQFEPFDPGVDDLEVFVHKKGEYLYAFPRGGRSLWRIGYEGAGPQRDRYYRVEADGIEHGLGPRFVRLLVEKFADALQCP